MRRTLPLLALLGALPAHAGPWHYRLDSQLLVMGAPESAAHRTVTDAGFLLSAAYQDDAAIIAGLSETRTTPRVGQPLDYARACLSLRWHRYPDWLAGRTTLRLDGYRMEALSDNAAEGSGSAGWAALGWQAFSGRYGIELAGGYSRHPALELTQWSPVLGFRPFTDSDWITLRGTQIQPSAPGQPPQTPHRAGELRWTHTFSPNALAAQSAWVTLRGGQRIYYIDPDAVTVTNRADLFREGANGGLQLRLSESVRLIVVAGAERVSGSSGDYLARYGYLDLVHHW